MRDARSFQTGIGTGPFKFVQLKQNESVKFTKNENYWKEGRPYLDGIEYTIIKSRATRVLGFIAGEFDMTWWDVLRRARVGVCCMRRL